MRRFSFAELRIFSFFFNERCYEKVSIEISTYEIILKSSDSPPPPPNVQNMYIIFLQEVTRETFSVFYKNLMSITLIYNYGLTSLTNNHSKPIFLSSSCCRVFRYFPVREIYEQTSGYHHLHLLLLPPLFTP